MKMGIGIGISPAFIPAQAQVADGPWTPAQPTTDGGQSPHSWFYPDADLYQDSGLTIPAVSDGDVCGGWINQGSDIYNITQATTSNKPTLKLNIKNGKSVVRYVVNNWLVGAFSGGSQSQPNTLFVVFQVSDTSGTRGIVGGDDTSNRHDLLSINTSEYRINAGASRNGGTPDTSWHIASLIFDGASSELWRDGTSIIAADSGSHAIDGLKIGGWAGGGSTMVGDIAEYLLYTSRLSVADLNQINDYLSLEYDISVGIIT